MDLILLLKAVVMGVVEGVTEFLPISSTGHLILASDWLEFNRPDAKTFEVVIQLGAILSVCWHFRTRLGNVVRTLGDNDNSRRFAIRLIVAFMPAAVFGLALHDFIKHVLFSPLVVAWALVVGGVLILVVERFAPQPTVQSVDAISVRLALKIGFAQTLALVPGISRSGATIMGGLAMGVSRQAATEFSFFLAIPVMFAATVLDVYKSWHYLSIEALPMFAVGFFAAFASALVAIRFLLRYVATNSFVPFAWYRIGFGLLVLWSLSGAPAPTT